MGKHSQKLRQHTPGQTSTPKKLKLGDTNAQRERSPLRNDTSTSDLDNSTIMADERNVGESGEQNGSEITLRTLYIEIKKSRETMTSETNSIKQSIEFIHGEVADLKTAQSTLRKDVNSTAETVSSFQTRLSSLEHEVLEQERYQRGFNLLFFGIEEKNGESVSDVLSSFMENKLKMSKKPTIENCHRLGHPSAPSSSFQTKHPKPIIARFVFRPERLQVLIEARKLLKGTTLYVKEDLPKQDREAKKRLQPVMIQAWQEKKKVRFIRGNLYINGNLYRP